MKTPEITYINQLHRLREDLIILINDWPTDLNFDTAKTHAEAMLPLIAGQIAILQNSSVKLNPVDPITLYNELDKLCNLIPNQIGKQKFSEYIAMLDTLING